MNSEVKNLPALDGVRVLATAGIFLFHAGLLKEGTFPVTLFFMLSGFMMYYTKKDTIKPVTGIGKMKKMYPVHFLTFILAAIVWNPWSQYSAKFLIKAAILQLTLTQSWFSVYAMTYNGLAWYLSVIFFLYAISFPLVALTRKINKPFWGAIVLLSIITAIDLQSRAGGGAYIQIQSIGYWTICSA